MKTEKTSRPDAGLLAKYLSGEMTGEEASAFEEEIAVSDGDKTRIEKLKKQWSAMNRSRAAKSPHTHAAWDKLHDRLQEENLIPAQPADAATKGFVFPLLKIAAALLFLLGIAAVAYFSVNRRPAVEMVRLNTGAGDNTLVKTLADGSVIYIAQNSLFSFPEEFKPGSRNVELKGEAFFDIAPNPAKPFIIETDRALIEVLGTAFNVKTHNGNGFELFVNRGKVKVTLKSDLSKSELVVAGEKISTIQNSLVKSKFPPNESPAWFKQRMHFKDEPLRQIINVLNRNFNTNFVLADSETGKHKMTVTFDNETAATMNELICVTLNLKSQTIHGAVVFFENRESAKHQ
ncbi:MAG: FecR domain-containing protein [Bacteroidota bacterium]